MTAIVAPIAIARCPLPEPNRGKVLVVIATRGADDSVEDITKSLSRTIFEALREVVPNDGQRSILFSDADRQIWQQLGLGASMAGLHYEAEVIGHVS